MIYNTNFHNLNCLKIFPFPLINVTATYQKNPFFKVKNFIHFLKSTLFSKFQRDIHLFPLETFQCRSVVGARVTVCSVEVAQESREKQGAETSTHSQRAGLSC